MCIIVYNKTGKALDKGQMQVAYDNNPHGYGLMWYDKDTKRIRTIKRHDSDFESLWGTLQKLEGITYALHLRWRTRGAHGLEQCHPHKVVSMDDGAPEDVFLMHNGTFAAFAQHKSKSDTKLFAQKLRSVMRGTKHEFEKSLGRMNVHVNTFDKLLFMHSSGKVTFVNDQKGSWIDGVWYSNTYSFEEGYRKPVAQPTLSGASYYGGYSDDRIPYWKDPSPPKVYRGMALGMPATSMKKKKLANKKSKRAENKKTTKARKEKLALLHGVNGTVDSPGPGYYIDGKGRRTYVTDSGAVIRIR